MNRRISQKEFEAGIRSHLADAGSPEPSSLGDVLNHLPRPERTTRRALGLGLPSSGHVLGLAAVGLVIVIAAAVGVPLMMSKPGPAGPSATATAQSSPVETPAGPPPAVTSPGASGNFVATGSMASSRAGATATRLSDRRVLITGGWTDNQTILMSAELYDPTTGKFSPTGSMVAAGNGTATLLQDGRVLLAGGTNDTGTIAAAELYDPSSGTFSLTGSMQVARTGHSATLLPNGRVLMAGGGDGQGMALSSAELYDPATGKFSPTGSMALARFSQSAALLPNGLVLVAGGVVTTAVSGGIHPSTTTQAELYDSATGMFSSTGSMTTPRSGQTTTLLDDGRVLFAGGLDKTGAAILSAEVYDLTTGKFTLTGSMVMSNPISTAALLSDGRVLIVGGSVPFSPVDTAQLFDPKTGTFSLTGTMTTGRSAPTATLLADGRVLITGGGAQGNASLASAELYQP
jgi:hypothetical protein